MRIFSTRSVRRAALGLLALLAGLGTAACSDDSNGPSDAQDLRPDPAAGQSAHQRSAAEQGEPSEARHDRARHRSHHHRPGDPLLHHRRRQRGRTLRELCQHPRQRAAARRAGRADGQRPGDGRLAELAPAGAVQQRLGRTEAAGRRDRPRTAGAVRRSVRGRPRRGRRQRGTDDRPRRLRLPGPVHVSRTSGTPTDARARRRAHRRARRTGGEMSPIRRIIGGLLAARRGARRGGRGRPPGRAGGERSGAERDRGARAGHRVLPPPAPARLALGAG